MLYLGLSDENVYYGDGVNEHSYYANKEPLYKILENDLSEKREIREDFIYPFLS